VRETTHISWPDSIAGGPAHLLMRVVSLSAEPIQCPWATVLPQSATAFLREGDTVEGDSAVIPVDLGDAKVRFSRLVLPHLPAAYGLARSLTSNPADAEDVVQEACIRAFRAIGGTNVANARAWVLTIVHNTAYTWLKKNRPATIIAVDNLEAVEQRVAGSLGAAIETPEAAVIAKADRVRLEAALQELPALFREVLVLREIEGLSYREIAEVTGVPIGTVMSRIARARERLISAVGRNPS
jgi:RNA polymerase sigma factor (sigma-70 family)